MSGLQLTRGEVEAAAKYGRRAVEYADRSGDWGQQTTKRSAQADAEHQAGRSGAAEKLFREAERLQQEHQPQYLYSIPGYSPCLTRSMSLASCSSDADAPTLSLTPEAVKSCGEKQFTPDSADFRADRGAGSYLLIIVSPSSRLAAER